MLSYNIHFLGHNFKILSKPIEKQEYKKQEIQAFYTKSYNCASFFLNSSAKMQKGKQAEIWKLLKEKSPFVEYI